MHALLLDIAARVLTLPTEKTSRSRPPYEFVVSSTSAILCNGCVSISRDSLPLDHTTADEHTALLATAYCRRLEGNDGITKFSLTANIWGLHVQFPLLWDASVATVMYGPSCLEI